MPSPQALQMVTEIRQPAGLENLPPLLHPTSARSSMGAGIPPVPEKMVSRIEAGEFIEMAELLPDRLGSVGITVGEDQARVLRPRRKAVTNIFEWVECFAIYVAVLSRSQPQRVPEMLGYLILILEAHMEHAGDGWIGYDRRFRMTAAGNPSVNWATIDTTLWHLAFSGKGKCSRCKHFFSLLHSSNDCEWGPEPSTFSTWINPPIVFQPPSQQQRRQICRNWNNTKNQAVHAQTVAMSIFASVVHLILMFQIKGIKLSFVHTSRFRDSPGIGQKPLLKRITDSKD